MLEDIKSYLEVAGQSLYGGEAISQLEHAKQCAMHAEIKGTRLRIELEYGVM